jgi:hypothetical protein
VRTRQLPQNHAPRRQVEPTGVGDRALVSAGRSQRAPPKWLGDILQRSSKLKLAASAAKKPRGRAPRGCTWLLHVLVHGRRRAANGGLDGARQSSENDRSKSAAAQLGKVRSRQRPQKKPRAEREGARGERGAPTAWGRNKGARPSNSKAAPEVPSTRNRIDLQSAARISPSEWPKPRTSTFALMRPLASSAAFRIGRRRGQQKGRGPKTGSRLRRLLLRRLRRRRDCSGGPLLSRGSVRRTQGRAGRGPTFHQPALTFIEFRGSGRCAARRGSLAQHNRTTGLRDAGKTVLSMGPALQGLVVARGLVRPARRSCRPIAR